MSADKQQVRASADKLAAGASTALHTGVPAAVPDGWLIRYADDNRREIIVQKPGVGGYLAREDDDENIASFVLHQLAADLLATPSASTALPAASDAAQKEVLSAVNDALCNFAARWKVDGDYLRCAKCKRPMIASRTNELEFVHEAGCKADGKVETRPWLALIEILRPLSLAAAPTAQAGADSATIAGLESAASHLSALVDQQRALLAEVEDVCGRDAYGAPFEDGESGLIDRVRGHLKTVDGPTAQAGELPEPHAWLYYWTHSSATGRPDEKYTGVAESEESAKRSPSNENVRPVFTADQMTAYGQACAQAAMRGLVCKTCGARNLVTGGCDCDATSTPTGAAIAGSADAKDATEEAAKAIYRLLDGADAHPWTEHGNSFKQDEARRYARAAIAASAAKGGAK